MGTPVDCFIIEFVEHWILAKDPAYQQYSSRESKWKAVYNDPNYAPLMQCIQQKNPLWPKKDIDFAQRVVILYKEYSDMAHMSAHGIAAQVGASESDKVAIELGALKERLQDLNLVACLCDQFGIKYTL